MGQFKPMVKMMTTEPTVELKLAKGGAVKMKKGGSTTKAKKMADGGVMGALVGTPALLGRPAVNASVRAPGRPSMSARRRAMANLPMAGKMKKGGEAGESKGEHQAEMKALSGLKKELKSHESKPASKGHKGLKTGGVIDGQGGYKNGGLAKSGIINTESQGGEYRNTKMHTAKPDRSPANTGGVKDGNGGGYATGGVAKANGGGYKKGGSSKKAYATGGTVNKSGFPVAMPQGQKPASRPVAISRLAGTYKQGGSTTPAEATLLKNHRAENATAMREAKADSNLKYGPAKRMASGGAMEDQSKGAYDRSRKVSQELEEALNPLSMAKELFGKAKNYFMPSKGSESVTKTKESVTVTPAGKKRGGLAC